MSVRPGPTRAAPTTAAYRESPLWWEQCRFPPALDVPLPRAADVVIIGAGYTGLAAALQLCKRGLQPLVLDRDAIGRGASGRNAGMIHGGLRFARPALERRYGAPGRA